MLLVGVVSLIAAQVLGILGLVRRGYEVLVAIAMLVLFLPPLLMSAAVVMAL